MSEQEFAATWEHLRQRLDAWAMKFMQDMQPLIQAIAPYLPKQKIVDRRKLAARRARRRNERKAGLL